MTAESASNSIHIGGHAKLSQVQIGGQAGQDAHIQQTQQISQGNVAQPLTAVEVRDLLNQVATLFRMAGLPEADTEKAIAYLEATKEETQAAEPDKEFALKNFQRATKVLQEAGATAEATEGLWKKLEAIAKTLAPWFGVAVKALLPFA
jgi:hypothetical protein